MTRLGFLLVLASLAASAPAVAQPLGYVRDVRPTTLEVGDTLVVEADNLAPFSPGTPMEILIDGYRPDGRLVQLRLRGKTASGDRVLAKIEPSLADHLGGPLRLTNTVVHLRGDDDRVFPARDGDLYTLDLLPRTLRSATAQLQDQLTAADRPFARVPWLATIVIVLALALVLHLLVAPITGLVTVWERKVAGRMQSRFGPNRVGPRGWLQWLADALKLITKEDLVPLEADRTLFRLSPYLMWMSVFATFVVLPLSQQAIVANMNVGLLYLVSVTSFTVIAILMGGWASNSKWSLLGGMRSAAQIVSYELPGALALLQIALLAGTLAPQEIVRAQGGLPHQWFAFSNPFAFLSFFVYFISALAEGNRTPFDLPEAESELVAGYFTEYSGFRFSVFFLAEWTNLYVIGAIASMAFLGGWNVPFVTADAVAGSLWLQLLSLLVMVAKIVTLVFVIIWIRWTLPRLRVDQMMALCWKYLVPFGFVAFLATAGWVWLTASVPVAATLMRWLTFLVGGVGLLLFFAVTVVRAFRSTRLLYVGDRQFTWPFETGKKRPAS